MPPLGGQGKETLGGTTAAQNGTQLQQYWDVCGKCGARRIDNQIGLEPTPEAHIEALLEVFREVKRVMRADASLWLNYGDCYYGNPCGGRGKYQGDGAYDRRFNNNHQGGDGTDAKREVWKQRGQGSGLKNKDLVMMPYRLAIALQADGWFVRSAITICKNNPMPESVTDRPTNATEMLFLLTKSERYFYDADAIRERTGHEMSAEDYEARRSEWGYEASLRGKKHAGNGKHDGGQTHPAGRNKRNWWLINSQPMKDAHYAAFSEKLVEPCILAGTSERGVCPTCGAPWERVTEEEVVGGWHNHEDDFILGNRSESNEREGENFYKNWKAPQTTGWRPTCIHPHTEDELLPGLVLDCFAGSGTVSRVASRLGRRSIGIELSEEYVEKIARKRTSQGSLGL